MVLTDERIETKDWIMDEKGIRMKFPVHKKPPFVMGGSGGGTFVRPPIPPGTKHPVLSPEHIRKIEELKKLQQQRMIIVKTPTPKPTP
jgi:hypothetical protein